MTLDEHIMFLIQFKTARNVFFIVMLDSYGFEKCLCHFQKKMFKYLHYTTWIIIIILIIWLWLHCMSLNGCNNINIICRNYYIKFKGMQCNQSQIIEKLLVTCNSK